MADSPVEPPAPAAPAPAPPATPPPEPEPLGDAGKRALDEERAARKAAEKAARDATAALERVQAASMTEQERAVAAAKAEGKAEATKEANARLLRAEVRAAAAGKLADPADAIALLDLDELVDRAGEADMSKISAAIDKLVREKPYLGAMPGNGSGEGGARGAPASKPQNDPLLASVQRAVGGISRT